MRIGGRQMNRNRKLVIDFRINGKHDHYIKPKKGKSIKFRATKPKRTFKATKEEGK